MIASIQGSLAATSFACSRSGLPQRPQARAPRRMPRTSPTSARLTIRLTLPRFKPFTASTAIRRAEGGTRADQEGRTSGSPRHACQHAPGASKRRRRSSKLPAPLGARGRRACDAGHAVARHRPQDRGRAAASPGRNAGDSQERLHALLGRLHGHRQGCQWRVDRPGAGLGLADQSRLALLQRRGRARRRAQRAPATLPGEARERDVEPDLLGSGDRRDRRPIDGDPREVGTRIRVLARLRQVHQRGSHISIASSPPSGEPTIPITRPASVTPPLSPASPTPGATGR